MIPSILMLRPDFDRRIALACFGAACALGLAFAFVGLGNRSLWFDELFTLRLLEPEAGTTLFSRIATDVHPPVYLTALAGFTWLAGDGETGLRLFSAIAACGAIVIFIAGTRSVFSLPARLFAAALATGSLYWFNQSQNARSYALCLLIVAGMMALGVRRLRQGPRTRGRLVLPALLTLMLAGTFTHFYVLYVSLALLGMLFLLERRDRIVLAAAAVGLVLLAGLYVKLVVEPHTRVSLNDNWYQNNVVWYLDVLQSSLQYTFGLQGRVALVLCVVAILSARLVAGAPLRADKVTLMLAGVPLLVLVEAIVSSTLLAPNFWDRNFLVVSPFIWGLVARTYDAALERASPTLRLGLVAALGVLTLSTASVATARLPSSEPRVLYEPFRQSAAWIKSLPACRGQTLPVITTDRVAWYKPGYAEWVYGGAYGHYLQGFAPTELVFAETLLPDALKPELQRRLRGEGCPVIAWTVHNMTAETIAWLKDKLLASLDRRDDASRVMTREFDDGAKGYVLYVKSDR